MGLYIGIFTMEEFFRPFSGKLLHLIYTLASSVIPVTRIAFCIFVCTSAGRSLLSIPSTAAICIAVGNVSFEDCDMLT